MILSPAILMTSLPTSKHSDILTGAAVVVRQSVSDVDTVAPLCYDIRICVFDSVLCRWFMVPWGRNGRF